MAGPRTRRRAQVLQRRVVCRACQPTPPTRTCWWTFNDNLQLKPQEGPAGTAIRTYSRTAEAS